MLEKNESGRSLLWQVGAGVFFIALQLVVIWQKSQGDFAAWAAQLAEKTLWEQFGYFSLGLLGAAVVLFALAGHALGGGDTWKRSGANLHNTRLLVFAALMIAMARALSLVPGIPIAHTKLTFGFLARALCALVCGPVLGLVYGFVEDILGFILQPSGEFFFGYTLSTMLGVLCYALCFYRRRLTVANIVLANLLVNLLVNAVLGSVWNVMTRGAGFMGWFVPSLAKNLLTIIPKSVLLYFLFRGLLPILQRMGVIPRQMDERITWL